MTQRTPNDDLARRQKLLRFVDRTLTFGGMVLVIGMATILAANPFESSMTSLRLQLAVLFVGLAANQIGIWNMSVRVFSQRRYHALRAEVESFIDLVREMNREAIAGDRVAVERVAQKMYSSVERMKDVAGVEEEIVEEDEARTPLASAG